MSKETAVELLVGAIRDHIAEGTLDAITISRLKMIAKAIEREQIEQAFVDGVDSGLLSDADKYYEIRYKGGSHE